MAKCILLGLSMLTLCAEENSPKQARFQTDVLETSLPRHILSNQGIVMLSEAGYDEDFLIDLIQNKQTRFDTTVEGLTFLARHGISERIIRFMMDNENKPAGTAAVPAPAAVAIPAKVVRQKVLVPAVKAEPQILASPVIAPGTQALATLPGTVMPYQYADPAFVPYTMVNRHLFGNRWYVVNPYYAPTMPAVPLHSSGRLSTLAGWPFRIFRSGGR